MHELKEIKLVLDGLRSIGRPFMLVNNSEWYSLFHDEIRNSIAIEGIFTDRNQLLAVLEGNQRTTDQKSAAILGYFEAASTLYDYANNQYTTDEFSLRLSDLKQIHTLLMKYEYQFGSFVGKLGGFREENVAVTSSNFTPLNYLNLNDALPIFVKWLNENLKTNKFDLLTSIAASHIVFETIHPFRDGNGRVGRILLSYILIGTGLLNISIKGTAKVDREKYYSALETGDNQIESFLRRIEQGETPTVSRFNKAVRQSNLEPMKKIILNRLNHSLSLIEKDIKTFNQDALLPLRDAAKYYSYSQDYLRQLIHSGKLKGEKRGKLWYVSVRAIKQYEERIHG
ncbi:MAG: Fic family protein [Candidatus Marinimicrobia bacterium]|nr:Fic family protein [Candidatus Neomarinimicrobiota bacterium]